MHYRILTPKRNIRESQSALSADIRICKEATRMIPKKREEQKYKYRNNSFLDCRKGTLLE